MRLLFYISLLITISGCSTVKPWQKQYLAKAGMQLSADTLESTLKSHIFFSKEATPPSESLGGGGCGCN